MTRWARSVARLNRSPSRTTHRWGGLTTPQERPRDGSPFAERPDTVTHVGFLARWVWLPLVATALLIIMGHQRSAASTPAPPDCPAYVTDYSRT